MSQCFTYSIPPHTLPFLATASHICVAEPRPHTYGVRHLPCGSLTTEPCRPTACNPSIPPHTLSFLAAASQICVAEPPTTSMSFPATVDHFCLAEPPRPTANYSLLAANSPTYTFSAKERDPETGLSYFGSRYYSSDLSVWLSVDPMSDKYPSLSPYTYCANNPTRIIDPSGDSCAVLLAGNALGGIGHMAILIQNKDKQWELYSKNGDDDGDPKTFSGEVRGTPDDQPCVDRETGGVKSWGSVQEFLDDPDYNTVNHDGEGGTYYTEAYVLPTTQNQDDIIRDGMKKKLDEKYNVLTNNCSQAVTYSLRKAGVNLVSRAVGDPMNFSGSRPAYVGKGTIPYVTFEIIRSCNPGNKLYYPKR